MDALNGSQRKITVTKNDEFDIGDTTGFAEYKHGGIVRQNKLPVACSFASLEEALSSPKFDDNMHSDFSKLHHPPAIHAGIQAVLAFSEQYKRLPNAWNQSDCDIILALSEKWLKPLDDAAKEIICKLSYTCQGLFPPIAAFLGGVVAQECLKGVTRKFVPIRQWYYPDAIEIIPKTLSPATFALEAPSRSSPAVICIGKELYEKVAAQRIFMVGAGAVGCELLKNYAMLGVGSKQNGCIIVTDPDVIENSNLNRQFLFRECHLRKPKATTASSAAIAMNPDLKGRVKARLDKVHEATEDVFSDAFFCEVDIVSNALDNVRARIYVDARCVSCRKPLLEPGTLGSKGHVQVISPHQTESYGSQADPEEETEIPFCTLRMFPEETVHCVEWARDRFEKLFTKQPGLLTRLLEDPSVLDDDLQGLKVAVRLLSKAPRTFHDCVTFARRKFQKYFFNDSKQLLHVYPLDAVTKEGKPFWALPKRPPAGLTFDPLDKLHQDFIVSAASLRAKEFGIPLPEWTDELRLQVALEASEVPMTAFVPSENKAAAISSAVQKGAGVEIEAESTAPTAVVDDLTILKLQFGQQLDATEGVPTVRPDNFEKDEDGNFHIDFLHAMTNLRARNYGLEEYDWLQVKIKAGRIIPALVTTTAVVAGLVAIQLVQLVSGSPIEQLKNSFVNLAVPFIAQSEPGPPPSRILTTSLKATIWDRWEIRRPNITIAQLFEALHSSYGISVVDVFCGAVVIYMESFLSKQENAAEKARILSSPLQELARADARAAFVDLTVTFLPSAAAGETPQPVRTPTVRVYFKS